MLCALLTPIPELSVCLSLTFGVSNPMKKLVYSALALSVTTAGALASDDWSDLDEEIAMLTASTALDTEGPDIDGRIRTLYAAVSDADVGDFDLVEARLQATGSRGDYSYKLQVDFANEPEILDAYIDFPLGGQVNGRFGQFKSGFSRSGLISSGNLFFVSRNVIGALWAGRSEGIQVFGEFDQLGWWVTVQDGIDTVGDEYLITARVSFDLLGEGATNSEGAYGGTQEPSATAAIAFFDDGGGTDNDGILLEFYGGTNVYSFGLDVLDVGDGGVPVPLTGAGAFVFGDSTPFSVMGTYMLQPDTWEVGLRFEDLDDMADSSLITVGVNNYLDGHDLKWSFNYVLVDSDDAAVDDLDALLLQLQLGF